jgi:hypothetical protein
MKKQKKHTKIVKKRSYRKRQKDVLLSLGNIAPDRARILLLIIAIIFASSILIIQQIAFQKIELLPKAVVVVSAPRNTTFASEIRNMVKGYPIEAMTPYIAKQDPKVAAFLIAIAKKESAWGKRHPVLDGQDCYNYWGFRLKSERMGSGGHTCFDSPQQAVETVGARLEELVNNENIDTPKDMIVWKCGYGCQDQPKTLDEKKWIKDVNMYYQPFVN